MILPSTPDSSPLASPLASLVARAATLADAPVSVVVTDDKVVIGLNPATLKESAAKLRSQAADLNAKAETLDSDAAGQRNKAAEQHSAAGFEHVTADQAKGEATELTNQVNAQTAKKTQLEAAIAAAEQRAAQAREDASDAAQEGILYRYQGEKLLAGANGDSTALEEAFALMALADSHLKTASGFQHAVSAAGQELASLRTQAATVTLSIEDTTTRQQFFVSQANKLGAEAAATDAKADDFNRQADSSTHQARVTRAQASELEWKARAQENLAGL